MPNDLAKLEQKIGYTFHDKELLRHALIHSSYANEKKLKKSGNNERLEFLGDAVLELSSSDFLYRAYPEKPEGFLTRERAERVCEPALAYCARQISLGSYLFLGVGEDRCGGRERDSVTSDALEALIGAIYLDGGFAPAKAFVDAFILKDSDKHRMFYDAKTTLQERLQENGGEAPQYVLLGEEGPDHDKRFRVSVKEGDRLLGVGIGRSKKQAEQDAAFNAIKKLEEQ